MFRKRLQLTVINSPLMNAISKFGDNPAIITESYKLTYFQLANSVMQTIEKLKKLNIATEKPVAIISQNSVEQIILLLALWHLKIIAAPLSLRNPIKVINTQIQEINAAVIFSDKNIPIDHSMLISEIVNISNNEETEISLNSFDANQDATLIFTSGSSSKPKAVLHTYGNYYYSALGSNKNLPLHRTDRWLLSLPIYHVGGLGIIFRCLQAGAAIVIPPPDFKLSDIIEKNNITHFSLVVTQLRRLLKDMNNKDLLSLKAILLGGSMISSSLIKEALDLGLPIYKSYGMTEMASQVCTTEKLNSAVKHSGKILPYRAIKLSSNKEILVKGETLFKGYYLKGKVTNLIDAEGWFLTGDIGEFDNDNNLIVTGRIDNQFISGGENISSEEIENVISELYDFEKVIVVPVSNEEFGQRPVVFISGKFDQNEIVKKLNKKLPSYKIPDYFFKWPEHLTEASIKPSRKILSQMAEKLIKN